MRQPPLASHAAAAVPGRRVSVNVCTFVLVKQVHLGFTSPIYSAWPSRCADADANSKQVHLY